MQEEKEVFFKEKYIQSSEGKRTVIEPISEEMRTKIIEFFRSMFENPLKIVNSDNSYLENVLIYGSLPEFISWLREGLEDENITNINILWQYQPHGIHPIGTPARYLNCLQRCGIDTIEKLRSFLGNPNKFNHRQIGQKGISFMRASLRRYDQEMFLNRN